MSELNGGRSKAWNIYSSSNMNPGPSQSETDYNVNREGGPWNTFGSSMNAISFGFVATAILISMFVIMAIFEHLFRPNATTTHEESSSNGMESTQIIMHKLGTPDLVQTSYASEFPVVMPGQQCPTFIAQPAPLPLPLPCQREPVHWPSHQHTNLV